MKSNRTEITKKMLCGVAHHPVPGDHNGAESEEDDLEEENKKSLCAFSKGPEDPVAVCEEQPKSSDESLKEAAGILRQSLLVTVPEVSEMSNSAWRNELPVESDNLLLRDLKPFCTKNLTKNALDNEEANQRHEDNLCSFLTITNDKNSILETEGISEDYDMSLLSTGNKLGSCQITCESDLEAKLVSLNSEEKQICQCYSSNVLDNVPDNTEGKCPLKAEETRSNAWASFAINLSTEELQMDFNAQVSLSPCSEDKFVSEKRSQKVRKPEQTHTNSSAELSCYQSNKGLVKENPHETETEEVGNVISNGLSASPTGKVHFDSLVEARATFMLSSSEISVLTNDATPITLKRRRYRRIVNLAPKFNLPRQIFGHTEGGKDVPIREDIPQESVLEVRQEHFLSKNCGEAHEQDHALQEYSLPTPDADALLHNTYIHSGQCSPTSKYACRVCVDSKTKEEQATTLQPQQVVNKKVEEGEHISSEVSNDQPHILSSAQIISEYLEDSNALASCSENANGADDSKPAKASQLEDYQDADTKCNFLGLPLSLGFAFQLVQLFGSPGLPLESLLPDDYIVPLDWKVSKMIYLLWKTSVEEKQKTNGLQNEDGLTDDIISLEDLNKNNQDNQDSSETLSDMELCQDGIEENIITCTGCLDAAFYQS
ncbi:hypothetical protein Nmel_002650 [Mimus melanotis]